MLLSQNEAALFFKLMLPLQFFVNEKLGVLPEIETFEEYLKVSMEEKYKVRNALFKNVALMDDFIDENPQDFSMKELAIVSKWKKFIESDFFIERYLKNQAIFISVDDEVYAVNALTESLIDFFPKFVLPAQLKAILLPFQNKIVVDGFFVQYRMIFGSGIKRELKEIYNEAKKSEKIINNL